MSFLASFRADQVLSQLIAEADPASPNAQKLVDKLKKAGNKAVPKIIDALALSDKTHTMVLVDILGTLVNDKNLDMYREGLADGNERVVSGTAWPCPVAPITMRTACSISSKTRKFLKAR